MKLVKLGDICRFEYGKSLSEKVRRPGSIVVYGSNGPVGNHSEGFTKGATIIIGRKGSIGAVHVSTGSCWPIDTTYFIDSTCTDCDLDWLTFNLRYLRLEGLNKASGVPGLNREDAYKQTIRLPEKKNEQRQIAALLKVQLSEVETARQAAQAQLKDAQALRASVYRKAFQKVVPVATPPVLNQAPDGWRWRKITEIARLESGHTPSRQRPDWWGGDVSWVSLTEIRGLDGTWVESTQLRTNAAGITNSAAGILPSGTVCFSRTASVGFVCIMATPMATSQDFANWVCGDELEPEFLMHALIRSRNPLRDLATGATHKTIYMPTLKAFLICVPPREKQQQIVERLKAQLTEVDALRAALDSQLAEIERLPQRLLAHAFNPQGGVT